MHIDPFQAPGTDPVDTTPPELPEGALYTTAMVRVATFLGGFIGGGLVMMLNSKRLGRPSGETIQCVAWPFVATLVLFVIDGLTGILEHVPTIAVTVVQLVIMGTIADKLHAFDVGEKLEAGATKASWWRAIGVSLIGLVLTLVIVVPVLFVLDPEL